MKLNTDKRSFKVYIPLIAVVLIVFSGVWYWYDQYKKFITTDDAHVDADYVAISSKMLGRIAHLYSDEGDSISKGKLIAELDSSDLLAQKYQFIAMKGQAVANQLQANAKYKYDIENIKVLEINVAKTQDDFDRAKNQFSSDVITKEQYEHIKKTYETAQAQLNSAKVQLNVSKSQVNSASAAVDYAESQIGVIVTQLRNTKLYAPMNGLVAKRWLLTGDIVQPGQSLFTIINNQKLWVVVFLEETKLSEIHIGQKVLFTIDALPDEKFSGKVFSIGSNTASLFSLIPPNNASGNFTKVTQRVPIKVTIDGTEKNRNIEKNKILTGMSVVAKIVKD
jgi:membrane fusion protein (multidrug efflux system)